MRNHIPDRAASSEAGGFPSSTTTPTDGQPVGSVEPIALRPKEAARVLGIGPRKLWELTADRTSGIPHVRLGKAILYPVDGLRNWLASRLRKGGAA